MYSAQTWINSDKTWAVPRHFFARFPWAQIFYGRVERSFLESEGSSPIPRPGGKPCRVLCQFYGELCKTDESEFEPDNGRIM